MSPVKAVLLLQRQRIGGKSHACGSLLGMWVNFMVHQTHLSLKQRVNHLDKVSLLFSVSGAALE